MHAETGTSDIRPAAHVAGSEKTPKDNILNLKSDAKVGLPWKKLPCHVQARL